MSKPSRRFAHREDLARALGLEEERDPAVRDLERELDRLRPHRREVDRDLGAKRARHQLQRLAEPRRARPRVRDVVVLAVVLEQLAPQHRADDLDVLARLRERLAPRLAVPALDDLRARRAEAEQEAAAGEQVERRRRHRRVRRGARRDLQDRRADLQRRRRRGEPAEHADRVGAPRLRCPGRVVAQPLRLLGELDELERVRPRLCVAHVEAEAHDLRC